MRVKSSAFKSENNLLCLGLIHCELTFVYGVR